jgi:hypothetical protein
MLKHGDSEWTRLPGYSQYACWSYYGTVGGTLYVFGGAHFSGVALEGGVNLAQKLTPGISTEWVGIEQIPSDNGGPLARGCTAVLGNTIYAIGGGVPGLKGGTVNVHAFDTLAETWEANGVVDLPRPQFDCAAAGTAGIIYVVGGKDQSALISIDVGRNSKTWQVLPNMNVPRAEFAVVSIGDWLVGMGGHYPREAATTTSFYNIKTKRWIAGPDFKRQRGVMAAAVGPAL